MIIQHLYESIFPIYEKLYDAYTKVFDPTKYVVFFPQVGNAYPEAEHEGIILVGRAPNGWRNHLSEPNATLENIKDHQLKNSLQGIDFSNQFLSFLRKLSCRCYFESNPEYSFQHIAWTNLYRIAPDSKDNFPGRKDKYLNPDEKEQEVQFRFCDEILNQEIKLLSPKYVIFITGWDWLKDFSVGKTMPSDERQITTASWVAKINRPPLVVKKWVAENGINYILCDRPDYSRYDNLIAAITKLMQE